jgi:2,4-dienoyl-CoA reductase-like NADH-dependent reductase (Old Yellow Enzyme family)
MTVALFTPLKLRELTLPNRVSVSPMCQYISDDGLSNDWHLMHYGQLAFGAAGLVIQEMTDVSAEGRISLKCAGLYNDAQEAAAKRVVDFCKKFGTAKIGVQLAHAGRKGSTTPPALGGKSLTAEQGAWPTFAPSALPYAPDWQVPQALDKAGMDKIKNDFVNSVKRAERVGYDLIEFHAGHGYLIHQFLSPLSNQRTDQYGGSVENRMRFPLEIFAAMRAAWPADKPMCARVSAVDWVEGGLTIEQTIAFAKELKKLGCDYIDVSSGGLDPRQQVPLAPGYNAAFAAQVKKEAGIMTSTVGLITDAKLAEQIVSSGQADMIAIGRGAMWDPRWAWHAAIELGTEAVYPVRATPAIPSLRPQIFGVLKKAA